MAELKLTVRSPYLSVRKRIALHTKREEVRRLYSVGGPFVETWNMLLDDYDRALFATIGKHMKWNDGEEIIRF